MQRTVKKHGIKDTKKGRGRPQNSKQKCGSCQYAKILIVSGNREVFCLLQQSWRSPFGECNLTPKKRKELAEVIKENGLPKSNG